MQPIDPIERAWALTKAIEQAAAAGEWAAAAALANERSPLLMSLQAPQPAAALDILRRIHAIDRQIVADAQTARSAIDTEYQAAMQTIRCANAYQQATAFI
jgi:hypothetical protein